MRSSSTISVLLFFKKGDVYKRQVHGTVIQSPIQTFDEQSQNYHWTQKTYQIIPLFHPAAVFYNYRLKEVVKEDWQVVQKQLQLLKKV